MLPPLLLAAGLVLAPAGGGAVTDAQKILGTWKINAEVEDGKEAPAERSQKVRLTFTADKILLREGPDTQEGAYKLDPSRNPRAIEIVPGAGLNKGKKL